MTPRDSGKCCLLAKEACHQGSEVSDPWETPIASTVLGDGCSSTVQSWDRGGRSSLRAEAVVMQEDAMASQAAVQLTVAAALVAAPAAAAAAAAADVAADVAAAVVVARPVAQVFLHRSTAVRGVLAFGRSRKQGGPAGSVARHVAELRLQQPQQPALLPLLYSAFAFPTGMRQVGYLELASRLVVAHHARRADSFRSPLCLEVFSKATLVVGALAAVQGVPIAEAETVLRRHSRPDTLWAWDGDCCQVVRSVSKAVGAGWLGLQVAGPHTAPRAVAMPGSALADYSVCLYQRYQRQHI